MFIRRPATSDGAELYTKLRNCKIIDFPSSDVRAVDIGVRDGVVSEVGSVPDAKADKILDAHGDYAVPALVDLHAHVYHLGTKFGLDPDEIAGRSGVGVIADAGSAGAGNFTGFREYVIKRAKPTVYAFLNIAYAGIPFFGIQGNAQIGDTPDMDADDTEACARCIEENREWIVGIKVRLGEKVTDSFGVEPLRVAKRCAKRLGVPVMVHFGSPNPEIEEVAGMLDKGDILTHTFRPEPNSIVTEDGVLKEVKDAKKRGVVVDVGHGFGSFSFSVAKAALEDRFTPDTISTDLHALSYPEPARDLETTMTKLLNLGMRLTDVIKAVTYTPAMVIGRPRHASIEEGRPADLVTISLKKARVEVKDTAGEKKVFERAISSNLRLKGKEVAKV